MRYLFAALWVIQSSFCAYWITYQDNELRLTKLLVQNYSDRLDELSIEYTEKVKELKRYEYVDGLVKELSRP